MKKDNKGRFVSETEKVYMTGYKAFGEGMKCHKKQYKEDTVFTEPTADPDKSGMHFCRRPADVLTAYPICDEEGVTQFAAVEALEKCKTRDGLSFCTTKLRIGNRLSVKDFVGVCLAAERASVCDRKKAGGYGSFSEGTDQSVNVGGICSVNAGTKQSCNIGGSYSVNTGTYCSLNIGTDSSVNYGGNHSINAGAFRSVNAGEDASINAGGECSFNCGGEGSVNAGGFRASSSGGKNSICTSLNGRCKGGLGSFLAIAKRDDSHAIVEAASAIVDGKKIKADTWYELKDGRLVEVE